jgi:hypothetical protein
MVSEKETNMQLFLELRKAHKEKGVGPSREVTKAMKTQTPDFFIRKYTNVKRVRQWVL